MMKRRINLAFIVIFVCMIGLPYLFAHRDREERASSAENRMLAAYPAVYTREGGFNKDYFADFEAWINDNVRGRTIMAKAHAALQYRLFHRIVRTDTFQGEEPWLFKNSEGMIREYQRLNLLSEEELSRYTGQMQKISDYLKERGIAFYYFQCYDKEEIYPEKYVKGVNQLGSLSRADQVIEALKERTDVKQILVKDTLLAHKEEMIYFQYVDILHWNEKGSYYGYRALMEELGRDFPEIVPLREADYVITSRMEETKFYGFPYPYIENVPVYSVREPHAAEITEQTKDQWDFLHVKDHTFVYRNEACGNDLKILVFGDSYVGMFLKDKVAEGFRETLSIDWANIPIMDGVIEIYHPDIVVIESAQCALDNTVPLISEADFMESN